MTKKVLIIGGSGFLGKNIIRRCIKNNWKVFATHHKNKPKDNSFESFFFDLSKPKIPKKFNIKFDYVFFCAGEIDHSDQNYNKVLNEVSLRFSINILFDFLYSSAVEK